MIFLTGAEWTGRLKIEWTGVDWSDGLDWSGLDLTNHSGMGWSELNDLTIVHRYVTTQV